MMKHILSVVRNMFPHKRVQALSLQVKFVMQHY